VFVVALAIRLEFVRESAAFPTYNVPVVDAATYDGIARSVNDGKGADSLFWQPFFYPAFLTTVYFFAGAGAKGILAAKLIQAAIGALTCVLTCSLGRRLLGKPAGVLAGLIAALCGPLVFYDSELLGAGWAAFWAVLLLLTLIKAREDQRLRNWVFYGLVAAIAVLNRPEFIPFVVVGSIWLAAANLITPSQPVRTVLLGALAMAMALAVVLVPVATLNYRLNGHFTVLPSSGGLNLYIGNNSDTCSTLTTRPGADWLRLTSLPERNGVTGDEWTKQRYYRAEVTKYVRQDTAGFMRGIGRKCLQLIGGREIPRNTDIYVFRRWAPLLKALVWKAGPWGFPSGLLIPLAIVGLVVHWRRLSWSVVFFVILFGGAVVAVFVVDRYRIPILPIAAVLAAGAVVAAAQAIRHQRWLALVTGLIACTALSIAGSIPATYCEERPNYTAELHYVVGTSLGVGGRINDAIVEYEKVLEYDPKFRDALINLGAEYLDRNQLDKAINYLERAVQVAPDEPLVHHNLAVAYTKLNRPADVVKELREVARLSPHDAQIHYLLGNSLLATQAPADAVAAYREAIRLQPNFNQAIGNLGVALQRTGDVEGAIVEYQTVLQTQPRDAMANRNLISLLLKLQRFDEALQTAENALQANPSSVDANVLKGQALEALGRTQDALAAYQNALRLDPQNAAAQSRLDALAAP
jgi:tetratricopeptide (TPR) repeat protein